MEATKTVNKILIKITNIMINHYKITLQVEGKLGMELIRINLQLEIFKLKMI